MKLSLKERVEVLNKIYEYSISKDNKILSDKYLSNRGIKIDNDFGFIKYDELNSLLKIAPKYALMSMGFIKIDKKTKNVYQNLHGVCIPHKDENENVIAMSFRNPENGKWRYKNTENTEFNYPYNAFNVNSNFPLYVVEGAIDCLSMIQMGYKNCIAIATKSIRQIMFKYFEEMSFKKIYLCIDGGESELSLERAFKNISKVTNNGYIRQFIQKDANDALCKNDNPLNILSKVKNFELKKYDNRSNEGIDNDTKRWYNTNIDIKDLVNILGGKVTYNGKYKCIFPDHVESCGSMVLYSNNSFFCYGCNRGGFSYNMVYEYLKCLKNKEPKPEDIVDWINKNINIGELNGI